MSHQAVLEQLAKIRGIEQDSPYKTMIQSLEQLHMFDEVKKMGFFEENRIGFDFGTSRVYDDNLDDQRYDTDIQGSTGRIIAAARLMRRFSNLTLQLDAHWGAAAPSHAFANTLSVRRGRVVRNEWFRAIARQNPLRVSVFAWGKRAVMRASASNHAYGALSRRGEGWVEMRFGMLGENNENLLVPLRPAFYEGLDPEDLDNYPVALQVDWMGGWAEGGSDEEDAFEELEELEEDHVYIDVDADDSDGDY